MLVNILIIDLTMYGLKTKIRLTESQHLMAPQVKILSTVNNVGAYAGIKIICANRANYCSLLLSV